MKLAARVIITLVLLAPATLYAQPSTTAPATDENLERLARFRAIIENVDDSESTRIAQAEELLRMQTPAATAVIVELLTSNAEPTTLMVVSRALARTGRQHPELLDSGFVDALLALLKHSNDAVSASAGAALGVFPDGGVAQALSRIAGDGQAPLKQRLAALAALMPNTDRREVVGELVALLDADAGELVSAVIDALRTVADADYGHDIAAWRQWWQNQKSLSDTDWLRQQLLLRTRQLHEITHMLAETREQSKQRQATLASRLGQALAALYRLTPQPEKEALLESWLADPAMEYRKVAATMVAERISEGNLPSPAVRDALVQRYADETPEVRQLAIEIIGALNEPADAAALLARLPIEHDRQVRETILRVLGKLRNPSAIPPLVAELQRADVSDVCAAAAADALGMLATRGRVDAAVVASLVEPLKLRFAGTAPQARAVRVALLGAMAAIGAPEFKPEFEANLSAEDTELLLRAIRGVALVGNGAQLDRLSNLTTHPDARVRQRALDALGALGGEEQLSTITARMNPSVETVEGPRRAAWEAFKQICLRLPITAQLAAADRLADLANQRTDYLKTLHDRLAQMSPAPAELDAVREQAARAYAALGRNAEALPYWRSLQASALAAKSPRLTEITLAVLECALACDKVEQVDVLLKTIAVSDEADRERAATLITAYLDRLRAAERVAEYNAMVARLTEAAPQAYPALTAYLQQHAPPDAGVPAEAEPGAS